MDITESIIEMRKFYDNTNTISLSYRKEMLLKLRNGLHKYEDKLLDALHNDLNKSRHEAYMCELAPVYNEITFMLKHLDRLASKRKVRSTFIVQPAKCYQYPKPKGLVLIIASWNYPINLCLVPLVDALAAGNCAVVKPSEISENCSHVINELLSDIYQENYVRVVEGDKDVVSALLEERFDHILYTGNGTVAKIVLEKAAKHLTPCTLELGGKSPVLIDENADLRLAAKRIAFGKCLNSGQTCIAPDYVLIHENQKDEFIKYICDEIAKEYECEPLSCDYYPKIINEKHFNRLIKLMDGMHIVYGGNYNEETHVMMPTIIDDVLESDPIMKEEIFGPLLPILTYKSFDEAVKYVKRHERPLALYLFTNSKDTKQKVLDELTFGGGCINDTIMHIANEHLPFGGIGSSGMGAYHGKAGFETFSHIESIVERSKHLDNPLRYAPFTDMKFKMIRKIVK